MAIWVQKRFQLLDPPHDYSSSETEPRRGTSEFWDEPPPGFISPVPLDSEVFNPPDITWLDEYGSLVPPQLTGSCEKSRWTSVDQCQLFCFGGDCQESEADLGVDCVCDEEEIVC